jgi:predicted permease
LDEEVAATLDLLSEQHREAGLAPGEARRRAVLELGGVEQVKGRVRDVRSGRLLEDVMHDVRYGTRLLRRAPGFAVVVALTLAVGIGATTTVFSWARTTLLEPMPGVARQNEILLIAERDRTGHLGTNSYPDYLAYRETTHAFSDVAASGFLRVILSDGQSPERVFGAIVSGNYFSFLGVHPALGRSFLPEETAAFGTGAVVVLSDGLWRRRFNADPAVLGRSVTLDGHPCRVIGVAPPGFVGDFPGVAFSFWVPITMQPQLLPDVERQSRSDHWLSLRGRLRPGVTLEQAQAEFLEIGRRIEREDPAGNEGRRPVLFSLWQSPMGSAPVLRPVLAVLAAVVGLVLLLACANVANLLMVRGLGRAHEISLRLSLGASRGRLVRQFATESLLLGLMGGAGGLALARAMVGTLSGFIPPMGLPIHVPVGLDWSALAFAGAITLVTVLAIGIVPALTGVRTDLAGRLNAGGFRTTAAAGRAPLRQGLVVAQVALSMMLLAGAALFLRSVLNADSLRPGFDGRPVLVASLNLPKSYNQVSGPALYQHLLERVRSLPAVRAASLAHAVALSPFGGGGTTLTVDGYQPPTKDAYGAWFNIVSPDYFRTLSMTLLEGRDLAERDTADAPLVAIVNQAMAERYWNGRSAIGGNFTPSNRRRVLVVGIVKNSKNFSINEDTEPYFYLSYRQHFEAEMHLHVQATNGDPVALAPLVRSAMAAVDPELAVSETAPMADFLRFAFFAQRVGSTLLCLFGVMALLLAGMGLYGVVSHNASRRKREMGVRFAFGATAADVRRLIIVQGLRLLVVGLPVGVLGSIGLGMAARSQLYGVSPTDPISLGAAGLALAAVLVVAAGIPAWRAAQVDPVTILRQE